MEKTILQYQIDSWFDLAKCKSNNSPDLKISVSRYMQNFDISGIKIEVTHPRYGVLFAYTILPKGDLITNISRCETDVMHHSTLLNELKRYGFYVDYVEENNLAPGQVALLKTVQGLKYDKLRLVVVHDDKDPNVSSNYITAFNVYSNEDWINPGYSPSRKEWESALISGTAFNLSGLEEFNEYGWDWIYNGIYDIDKILLRYDYGN